MRLDKSWSGDFPADILRPCDLCFQALTNFINQSIVSRKFLNSLKLASISPVYKAKDPLDKTNYRPVSVLPLIYIRKINFWSVISACQQGFWVYYCVVLEKLIARNMLLKDYFSHCKRHLTTQNMLAHCSWICQTLMTVFLMIY